MRLLLAILFCCILPVSGAITATSPHTACETAAQAAIAEFSQYEEVPLAVAKPHVLGIYEACRSRDAPAQIVTPIDLDLVNDLAEDTYHCSGGGTTLLGWHSSAWILNKVHVPLANEPASSYWDVDVVDGKVVAANGYFRSVSTNIESSDTATSAPITNWEWFGIPMGFSNNLLGWNCGSVAPAVGLITSASASMFGTPLNIAPGILDVATSGRTCLVPC